MNMNLVLCPFCKTPIPEDCAYCDICGERLRKCSSCGSFAKSKICTRCGQPTVEINLDPIPSGSNVSQPIPGHLVCLSSDMRLGLCDEAIIGRRGSYGTAFQQFTSVSGLHAKLLYVDGNWKIEDIGSSYGTFVNGNELEKHKPITINVGDVLKFANIEFKVTE